MFLTCPGLYNARLPGPGHRKGVPEAQAEPGSRREEGRAECVLCRSVSGHSVFELSAPEFSVGAVTWSRAELRGRQGARMADALALYLGSYSGGSCCPSVKWEKYNVRVTEPPPAARVGLPWVQVLLGEDEAGNPPICSHRRAAGHADEKTPTA